VLLEVEPTAYVEALTAEQVPSSGVMRCPLPDHEDRTPSFVVYGAERGWFCFGCHRGGTVYDLAAALWGLPTRGSGFVELRRQVAEALLGKEAA
jgi:DNA primase